jgi:hypothetical protein
MTNDPKITIRYGLTPEQHREQAELCLQLAVGTQLITGAIGNAQVHPERLDYLLRAQVHATLALEDPHL